MKRIILVLLAVLSVPAGAYAQSIESILAAAPGRAREGAAVIKWNADYTYETLKEGTNQLVCYDRSSETRRAAFDVQCTNPGNLERVAQNRRFRVESEDRQSENALIAAAEADGTRAEVQYGSIWIAMRGEDQASAGTHTTIAVPGATTESTGLPDNRRAGGAYIMSAGTGGAHIMTPGN